MTSFNGTPIKKDLATKGIKRKPDSVAAQFSGYNRIVTASKPCTKDTLKLQNSKGVKRDCSYLNVQDTHIASLKSFARYGFGKEEADARHLTAYAIKFITVARN